MKPMLSATLEDIQAVKYPVVVSPKLDGIRCLIIGGNAYSRNMKPIPNAFVQRTIGWPTMNGLDGELIVGDPKAPDCYRVTNSGVMSHAGEPKFIFYVFDDFSDPRRSFTTRFEDAKRKVSNFGGKFVRMVPHVQKSNPEELHEYEAQHIIAGYEGVMGRSLDGFYKHGRATMREGSLWKLKRFTDGDYRVIGMQEQMHNANEAKIDALGRTERSSHKENLSGKGTMGAFTAMDTQTGVEFNIGTGFTDDERQDIWDNWPRDLNTLRKYKSLAVGVKDKPRHPVDLGPRTDI